MQKNNYKTMRRNCRRRQKNSINTENKLESVVMLITMLSILLSPFSYIGIIHNNISKMNDVSIVDSNDSNIINQLEIYDIEEVYNFIQESDEPVSEINNDKEDITKLIGGHIIEINNDLLVRHDLPNKYYPGLDFSSFQPYMGYKAITNKSSSAYKLVNDEDCYTDEFGLRRFETNENQFTIDGADDYVIALGTYYKDKGVIGNRYLIVTTNGMYTAITGDEKSDNHTDSMKMFSTHDNGKAGVIEWIVDQQKLNKIIKRSGTVTIGGPEVLSGEILYIYEIQESSIKLL